MLLARVIKQSRFCPIPCRTTEQEEKGEEEELIFEIFIIRLSKLKLLCWTGTSQLSAAVKIVPRNSAQYRRRSLITTSEQTRTLRSMVKAENDGKTVMKIPGQEKRNEK